MTIESFKFHWFHAVMPRFHFKWVSVFMLCSLLAWSAHSPAQSSGPEDALVKAGTTGQRHSCREIAARSDQYSDGHYWLQLQGKPVLLYCHDMAGEPREYLDLPEGNCSEYTSLSDDIRRVQTCFQRVRLDPKTLRVDVGDLTFSQTHTLGSIFHGKMEVQAMPYATAMSCDAPRFPAGKASIVLKGTGFDVVDTFKAQGYLAMGYVYRDGRAERLEVRGGGHCGWMAPGEVYNPMFAEGNQPLQGGTGFLLQLRLLDGGAP